MEISKNKVVELIYILHFDDFNGDIIEEVKTDSPFTFIYETGLMLEAFENNIKGLKKDDAFKFKIACNDAYGEVNEKNIVDLPKNVFEVDGKFNKEIIFAGAKVPMKDEQGNEFDGFIIDITKNTVIVDLITQWLAKIYILKVECLMLGRQPKKNLSMDMFMVIIANIKI